MTFVILLAAALPATAEVTSTGDSGFAVSHTVSVADDPRAVYKTMTNQISQWWDGEHSWSGSADNLYMDVKLGGCFCERLPGDVIPGGGVEHLRIVYLAPNQEIRFDGSLGPLQQMAVQGRMIWKIEAVESGSTISFSYQVHGHLDGGFEGLAPAVDGVIGEQLNRLKALLDSN
jgi:hypothetical protein